MNINDLCKKNVVTISDQDSIQQAAQLMKRKGVGSIIVIQKQNHTVTPVGIITDRDIVINAVAENDDLKNIKVSDVMCKDLLTLYNDYDINDAINIMEKRGVRRAPIINDDDEICGIVTLDDLFVSMAKGLTKLAGLVEKQMMTEH